MTELRNKKEHERKFHSLALCAMDKITNMSGCLITKLYMVKGFIRLASAFPYTILHICLVLLFSSLTELRNKKEPERKFHSLALCAMDKKITNMSGCLFTKLCKVKGFIRLASAFLLYNTVHLHVALGLLIDGVEK